MRPERGIEARVPVKRPGRILRAAPRLLCPSSRSVGFKESPRSVQPHVRSRVTQMCMMGVRTGGGRGGGGGARWSESKKAAKKKMGSSGRGGGRGGGRGREDPDFEGWGGKQQRTWGGRDHDDERSKKKSRGGGHDSVRGSRAAKEEAERKAHEVRHSTGESGMHACLMVES